MIYKDGGAFLNAAVSAGADDEVINNFLDFQREIKYLGMDGLIDLTSNDHTGEFFLGYSKYIQGIRVKLQCVYDSGSINNRTYYVGIIGHYQRFERDTLDELIKVLTDVGEA